MMNHPDSELVDLSLGGNDHAFETLIERHYMLVYTLAFKWCRIKEDAEEITQEVFIKLTRKLKTFNRKSSFKTWLYRITINTVKDYGRKSMARRSYESAFVDDHADGNPGDSPLEAVGIQEMYDAVDRLPPKQKASIMLVAIEGMSHKEAAEVLQCSETTVSWRIHQARKRLKKTFSGMARQ